MKTQQWTCTDIQKQMNNQRDLALCTSVGSSVWESLRWLFCFEADVLMSLSSTSYNTTSSPSFGSNTASNSLFRTNWCSSYCGCSWTYVLKNKTVTNYILVLEWYKESGFEPSHWGYHPSTPQSFLARVFCPNLLSSAEVSFVLLWHHKLVVWREGRGKNDNICFLVLKDHCASFHSPIFKFSISLGEPLRRREAQTLKPVCHFRPKSMIDCPYPVSDLSQNLIPQMTTQFWYTTAANQNYM